MAHFWNSLFLTIESWVLVYVVQGIFWYFVASWKKEHAKTIAWAALLISTIIFVSGLFFFEVRQFFHTLLFK